MNNLSERSLEAVTDNMQKSVEKTLERHGIKASGTFEGTINYIRRENRTVIEIRLNLAEKGANYAQE